jgi:hypothetical protein
MKQMEVRELFTSQRTWQHSFHPEPTDPFLKKVEHRIATGRMYALTTEEMADSFHLLEQQFCIDVLYVLICKIYN